MTIEKLSDHSAGIPLADNDALAQWIQEGAEDIKAGGHGSLASVVLILVDDAGRVGMLCQGTGKMDLFKAAGICQAAIHKTLGGCDL